MLRRTDVKAIFGADFRRLIWCSLEGLENSVHSPKCRKVQLSRFALVFAGLLQNRGLQKRGEKQRKESGDESPHSKDGKSRAQINSQMRRSSPTRVLRQVLRRVRHGLRKDRGRQSDGGLRQRMSRVCQGVPRDVEDRRNQIGLLNRVT